MPSEVSYIGQKKTGYYFSDRGKTKCSIDLQKKEGRKRIKKIDITGMTFGKLFVMYESERENKTKVYWRCKCECGNEVDVESFKLRSGHTKSCGCLKHESSGRKDRAGERFGRLTVIEMQYGRYKSTRCLCRCDCGNIVSVASGSLVNNITKSCGCLKHDATVEFFSKNLVGQRFGKLIAVERIKLPGKDTKYRCLCDCGNYSVVDGRALSAGKTQSCGCYKKSRGEIHIQKLLDDYGINYIPQYKFENCKHKRPLPFDFYLPDNNICIEYQGIQHYEPVPFFNGDSSFEQRKNKDAIKRQFCEENEIGLIEVPYYLDSKSIDELLLNTLNP